MRKKTRIFKSLICTFVCITMLSSCYTTKTEEIYVSDFPAFRKTCIGRTYNDIVTQLGAPQRRTSDGKGGCILVYEVTTTSSVSNTLAKAYNVNPFTKTYTPGTETTTTTTNETMYTQYFVNSNNICYDVKTNIPMGHTEKGNSYRQFSWVKTMFLVEGIVCAALGVTYGVICLLL